MAVMSPTRLTESLRLLGWSARYFAGLTGHTEKRVREAMKDSARPLGSSFTDPLEVLARCAEANPFPVHVEARAVAARERFAGDRRRREVDRARLGATRTCNLAAI